MKERVTKNMGIKLISLLCAFLVWLGVVNVANPIKTATEEVTVEILNQEVLERSNLTYEVVGKKTATISYKVRTKDEYRIHDTDFRAYADLSEMYDVTGAIPIRVEVVNNSEYLVSAPVVKSPEVVKIQTEELQTKSFALQAYTSGSLESGYQPGTITMSPAVVSVKGPMSQVGQISSVGIEFDIEGAASDISGTATPVYFDANGNRLEDLGETVRTLGGDVSYTMQVLKVKEVSLDFVVTGEVADGYRYTGAEASVRTISVAGLKSDLASLSTITIQDPALNIEGATQDKVCQLDLKDYVDSSVTIVGMENTAVSVTLQVEPLREKKFTLDPRTVTLSGQRDGYTYVLGDEKPEIVVRGLKEDLDSLSADKMNIQLDVSQLEAGTSQAAVTVQLDDAFEVLAEPSVTVTVTATESDSGSGETEEETESAETVE